ncbi:hypothetical protein CapIbe_012698 [Capra ibex]
MSKKKLFVPKVRNGATPPPSQTAVGSGPAESSAFQCFQLSWLPASAAEGAAVFYKEKERTSNLSDHVSSPRKLLSTGIKMAAEPVEDNCISFVEMKFINNTLYFVAENGDLESDHFGKLEPKLSIIRNLNDQVLFISQGNQPVFEDMPDSDCSDNAPQTIFIIYMYKDSLTRGLAVTISVQCKKMSTLSCENKIISFKEMNPPDNIDNEGSDIIFFQRSVPGHDDKIQFESSLYKGYFLACKKENDLFKLILKRQDDNRDKSVMFTVQNQN